MLTAKELLSELFQLYGVPTDRQNNKVALQLIKDALWKAQKLGYSKAYEKAKAHYKPETQYVVCPTCKKKDRGK